MKNIHILPTNEPSKIGYHFDICKEGRVDYAPNFGFPLFDKGRNFQHNPQNIYITSDEEIKDCWVLNTHTNKVYFLKGCYGIQPITKKIILTTDPKLIADGIQPIDDTFLEWFCKNSGCESVEVDTYSKKTGVETDKNGYREMDVFANDYRIVIPDQSNCSCENANDNTCDYCESKESKNILDRAKMEAKIKIDEALHLNSKIGNFGKPQQETLEESASRYACGWGENDDEKSFIAGAKWQQQVSQQIVPFDAYNIEVFSIKPDEQGKLFAYIGYKITNGNFCFSVVPFTEPQQGISYSEEDMIKFMQFIVSNEELGNTSSVSIDTAKYYLDKFNSK